MAHWKTPTELAKEVDSGNYSPTRYLSCEKDLTPDGGSFIVRFTEFTLFTKPSREGLGRFLIFQPQNLAGKEAVKTRERDLRARRLQSWLASWQKHPPDLERRADVSSMPRESRKHRDLSKAALQGLLAEQAMRAIATAQGGDLRVPPARAGQARSQQLLEVMAGAFLPGPLQSYGSAHALVGLCSEFEQVWTPVGYTRGELIGSVSLAPGERVTVEIHSWDKSTTKTESELASESELRTSEKYSQRDALTVLQEYAARQNTKVDMGLNVPLKVVTLNLGFGQVNDAQSRVNNTTENIREQTAEAANVLKVNRKMRIESSREVGRESKQTRVVENTNRCHTLNCHYFEIIANYLVSTRFRDVQPCLLIPYPRIAFTIDVVLCNEGVLRRSLLDRTFLPGFEAAHLLAVIREQKEISDRRRAERLSLIGAQLAPYAEQISDAYGVLEAAIAALDEAIEREGLGHQWEVAALLTDTQIDRIWAWHGLPT